MKHKAMIMTTALSTILLTAGLAVSDEDWHERGKRFWQESRLDVSPVSNASYAQECGECHFAYQPGLLPSGSWREIMGGLDDHFGENAELDKAMRDLIEAYLIENGADKSDYRRSRAIQASLKGRGGATLRITETPYFLRKHDELPRKIVRQNDKIGSMSNCAACHPRASAGSYNEHEIIIPGIGRWDD